MTTAALRHVDQVLAEAEGEDDSAVSDVIRESWRRSANAYHVDPGSDRPPQVLTVKELDELQEPAARSLEIVQTELDRLYRLVRPAHYVILLCDSNGVVIDHRGEETEAKQFRYWGTWLGGVWTENIEGTNGIGTAISEQRPVTVHRSEHFRARHMNLSCSGAPILAADGTVSGVLDVSSIDPALSEHAHALTGALTVAFARAIEERLLREKFRRSWIVAVRIPDDLGGAMLLAVDRDQRIVGAGRAGRRALEAWGHRPGEDIGLFTLFERNDGIFRRRNDYDDFWTQLRRRGMFEDWTAIVTPPEPPGPARHQPEMGDLHLRPRLDMLMAHRGSPQAAPAPRGGLAPAVMRRVREYVDTHLDHNLDLKALAAAAGLSPFHFARAFKQSEGLTPHDFVRDRRVAKARELLLQTDLPLSQIASLIGFADQSHFTRRFREVVGVSPGHFRKFVD